MYATPESWSKYTTPRSSVMQLNFIPYALMSQKAKGTFINDVIQFFKAKGKKVNEKVA